MGLQLDGLKARGKILRRFAQVANILYRQGFEVFVEQTPLASLVTPECRAEVEADCRCAEEEGACLCGHALPLPQRVLNTVVALGPTFIKFGQVASTRPDLVPRAYSEPLRALQEHVPPFPFEEVQRIVEEELGRPLEEAFGSFEPEPVASASLAQVHFAELPDGTPVAVKVQRPGIEEVIEQDLTILRWLARQFSRLYPGVRNLRPEAAVEEFGNWTLRELDFRLESENLDEFRRNFAGRDDVRFPRVYWEHTTRRCLTMERVEGLRVHEVTSRLRPHERTLLARRLAEIELQMFITDAFFHADLHPGNIFFAPDGTIVILDVGMVGRMSPETQDRFLCYWIAITRRQRERAFYHLLQMALSTDNADLPIFRQRYNAILDAFYGAPLAERSLAQTYLDILLAGAECNVVFPSQMMLQAKAVVTAEALDLVLDPGFQFTEEARPIVAREVARRASPRHLLDRVWGGLAEFILLGEVPPAGPAPTRDTLDERRFRREVLRSLAYVWADDVDERLREGQADVGRLTSAKYWQEHPERHAVLQTGLGLLRLLSMQLDRGLQASEPAGDSSEPLATGNGHLDRPRTGYRAFRGPLYDRGDDGRRFTTDVRQMVRYLEEEVRTFPSAGFWADKQIVRAGLQSGLTLLRLFTGQIAQAVEAWQDEEGAKDR